MDITYDQPFELLSNRVWRTYKGGAVLDRLAGKNDGLDDHFPEDWVGSATRAANAGREHLRDEGVSRARLADGREYSMEEVYQTDPQQALGAEHVRAFGPHPQLLVKMLDAAMRLHIQAHPSVPWARRHLAAESGKTEAWYILETRQPEAWVYLGFQHPPTPAQWLHMIDAQDLPAIEACFEKIPVKAGDVLLVEGGVPHAIGPGVFMVEVQEPTDYVVRCEYAHGGLELPESARTMGLGLDRVLDMFDYTAYPPRRSARAFWASIAHGQRRGCRARRSALGRAADAAFGTAARRVCNGSRIGYQWTLLDFDCFRGNWGIARGRTRVGFTALVALFPAGGAAAGCSRRRVPAVARAAAVP